MKMHTHTTLFDRVVCGVDRSDAGTTAAKVAGLVTAPYGTLTLVSANDPSIAVHTGWNMAQVLEELAVEAERALERGRAEAESLHLLETKLLEGDPLHSPFGGDRQTRRDRRCRRKSRHLTRHRDRSGAVSTYLLHEAPCAVLLARGSIDSERWPRRIVVGRRLR